MTGPQGTQGPIGVQGIQGVQGPTGPLGAWVGATGAGPAGYFQLGNIIQNWGLINANTVGVTGNFTKPYVDGPPAFTVGGSTGPTGGQPYVSAISKTGLVIRTQSGSAAVYWRTIGT
jgi:hypothetical protein